MVKADQNRIHDTFAMVIELAERLSEFSEGDVRNEILTNIQETIITIGDALENNTNSIDKKEIEEKEIIHRLEEICEEIFVCSYDLSKDKSDKLAESVKEIDEMIMAIPRTYRVVFLPYNASMWDSLESIWIEYSKDERCETTVVPIPYYNIDSKNKQLIPKYEGADLPEYVPIVYFEEYNLEEKKPDIIFIHNPYDDKNYVTSVFPQFYSKELKKHCEKLVYVPYYVNWGWVEENTFYHPAYNNADYIVFQCEKSKECAKGKAVYDKILPFGSPLFDKVIRLSKENIEYPKEWGIKRGVKKAIMLNTTIEDLLENNENLLDKLQSLFEAVKKNENVLLVWRPHPLLESTLISMRPHLLNQYHALLDYFDKNNIGVLDKTKNVSYAVACCDAYMGSPYSSIVFLFEACCKPLYNIILNEEKNKTIKIEELGDINPNYSYNVFSNTFCATESEEYTFDDFILDLDGETLSDVREAERKVAATMIHDTDGNCGVLVHEYLMKEMIG